jgi:3-mercaptopyruvate sulfurtransferase SseA
MTTTVTTTPVLLTVDEITALQQSSTNKLVFIDSSFKRIDSSVPYEEFLQSRIPGAVYFDISQFTLKGSPCPPMLPSLETFNESASRLGISNDDHLIVYGVKHSPSIARVVSHPCCSYHSSSPLFPSAVVDV